MNPQTPSLLDATLQTTKAFPAAAANNTSTALDIGSYDGTTAYARRESLELQCVLPAGLALVEAKTLTFTPQMSDDNGDSDSFAAIPQLGAIVVTGKTGGGIPTTESASYELDASGNLVISWPIPRNCEKYVAVNAAELTGGGDLTASVYTVRVVGFR